MQLISVSKSPEVPAAPFVTTRLIGCLYSQENRRLSLTWATQQEFSYWNWGPEDRKSDSQGLDRSHFTIPGTCSSTWSFVTHQDREQFLFGPYSADRRIISGQRPSNMKNKKETSVTWEEQHRRTWMVTFCRCSSSAPSFAYICMLSNSQLTASLRRSGRSPNLSVTFSLPVKVGFGCN